LESFRGELDHRLVIEYFHVFSSCADRRRAFLEFFKVDYCHLLNVHESLVFCIIDLLASSLGASACRRKIRIVVTLDFVELPLVEICQVSDRAQRLGRHSATLASCSLSFLGVEVIFDVLKIYLLILELVCDTKIFNVLPTEESEVIKCLRHIHD